MTVEIKILDDKLLSWGMPQRATPGSAGFDLRACIEEIIYLHPEDPAELIPTGIAVNILEPNVALILIPKSGLGHKQGLVLGNSVGLIDSDYQGQVYVSAWNRNSKKSEKVIVIEPGQFIAQGVFIRYELPSFSFVSEFSSETVRGAGGFGHSGDR